MECADSEDQSHSVEQGRRMSLYEKEMRLSAVSRRLPRTMQRCCVRRMMQGHAQYGPTALRDPLRELLFEVADAVNYVALADERGWRMNVVVGLLAWVWWLVAPCVLHGGENP